MVLAALLFVAHADTLPQPIEPASFSIRADPSIATQVNRVLAGIAEPVVSEVPVDSDLGSSMRERCGNVAVPQVYAVQRVGQSNTSRVSHSPCLAFVGEQEFVVEEGDRLENLAEIAGLRPAAFSRAEVRRPGALSPWTTINPTELQVGDHVRFRQTPTWITFRAASAITRPELISALAEALNCPATEAEDCLNRKGLDLLDAPIAPPLAPNEANEVEAVPETPNLVPESASALDNELSESKAYAAYALTSSGPVSVSVIADVQPSSSLPLVAQDQWPYDRRLVRAVLDRIQNPRSITIGVADAGLANRDGAPLPPALFDQNANEVPIEPDQTDDDRNQYVDDVNGGAVPRGANLQGSGDLSLCPGAEVPVDAWTDDQRGQADHGSIVASLATGLRLRRDSPESRALPRLIFYRLSDSLCEPPSPINDSPRRYEQALNYLFRRSRLVVLSHIQTAPSTAGAFETVLEPILQRGERLLVLSAGNNSIPDLDENRVCPACLGDRDFSPEAADHTIVVGAAGPNLQIAPYSNQGRRTVFIYAPGEPDGAIDLVGEDASSREPATSWAAPHVALSIALIQAQGVDQLDELRERLLASTWPLFDEDGNVIAGLAGVLNLTQAIAIRHYSVQVNRPRPDGLIERRTYVGRLETPLAQICPERSLSAGAVHAIRLGATVNRMRELAVRYRTFDERLRRYPTDRWFCTLPPKVRFTDMVDGPMEFDSVDVIQLLLPWRL